ncbi:MAG: hypothetical protein U5O39_11445 [Gammaproteobacteria bacterium]|nr:hypothetical protein [Gammaproteobacteria bacterium]
MSEDSEVVVDKATQRKFFLDKPTDLTEDEDLVFILNLHGGGSHGTWQHKYFPAHEYRDKYRLVVATPSAATREPVRRWVGEADDVVDTEPGQIYDTTCEGFMTKEWGMKPRPGTANVFVYPNARDDRVIADVVRLDKGHTEGLEPRITEELVKFMVQEPGGKLSANRP